MSQKLLLAFFLSLCLFSGNNYTDVGFTDKVLKVSEALLIFLSLSLHPQELIISITKSLFHQFFLLHLNIYVNVLTF